jgi:hypothetical protein
MYCSTQSESQNNIRQTGFRNLSQEPLKRGDMMNDTQMPGDVCNHVQDLQHTFGLDITKSIREREMPKTTQNTS